ncbi:MAG: hypothetical protein HYZ28_19530 [Myxococcales bacterium]|nr:hypothetical protein [Myxococcales bacterium]
MRARLALLSLASWLSACGEDSLAELQLDDQGPAVEASPLFLGDPANAAVFAVDVSHWEGPISQYEMDCFWTSGVRHLVSGTQVREVTYHQLDMAVSRGLTVDAYVYLYWDRDMASQVGEALDRAKGFPIGRLWLDVEQDPAGRTASALIALVQQAVDACRSQSAVGCGIYTGPGFWRSYMGNTTRFADLPLWYAQYNRRTSLSDWSTEKFGGWARPAAKQFIEEALCGVGVDKDVMQVSTEPLVVDRSLPPDTWLPPAAPARLYPEDGAVVTVPYAKLMTATVPRATRYQFALEAWDGAAFRPYYSWTVSRPFHKVVPYWRNRVYRFRARAMNAHGWGAWSGWATFDYGTWIGPRPGPEQPPSPPPPASGAPTGLSPDGVTVSQSGVTLSCGPVSGATRYEFLIEYDAGAGWKPYTSYASGTPSKQFWPQLRSARYRWKVRAEVVGTFGPWSSPASFWFP